MRSILRIVRLSVLLKVEVAPDDGHPRGADLDRSNVNNAYVSGMREELNMQGTDFNVRLSEQSSILDQSPSLLSSQKINTLFTCGYIVGMIPSPFICSMTLQCCLNR